MRAGKKQVAESGKTRPCIVYVKNLREEAEPSGGRLRKRDPRELQLQQQQQQQQQREQVTRRAGRSLGLAIQEKPLSRTRHAAKSPAASVASPIAPKAAKASTTTTTTPAAAMAKRRSTLVLGNSQQKMTGIGPRRGTQTDTLATPKLFKQAAAKNLTPSSPPPTIAANRSRRSIKPNPKYTSEDMVTPKYMASLSGESGGGSLGSGGSRQRSQAKPLYNEINDLLDLDEDNDDELADVAFNPQLHKSDEDDDEEFISDGEFEQELRREKLPAAKRGRGRPPKANKAKTDSSAAALASNRVLHKTEVNSGPGRTPVTSMQQLRRTLAGQMARASASLALESGAGGGGGTAKRKLDTSEIENVARKRLVVSSTTGSGQRSVPVVNGAAKRSTTPSAHDTNISKTKVANASSRMQAQRSAGAFKANPATVTTTIPNATNSSTRLTRGGRGSGGGGGGSGAGAGAVIEPSTKDDSEATFTIINIDDIMNQDDVLITRASSSATAGAIGGGASKKLTKSRLRINDILASTKTLGASAEKKSSGIEKSPTASTISPQAVKRLKLLTSATKSNNNNNNNNNNSNSNNSVGGTTKPKTNSQAASATTGNQQPASVTKPRPRILNTEMGKKTQPMKPLMSMGKELCPTDVDTEEDDPFPDLDLDNDFDLDESPPALIVTRRPLPDPKSTETGTGNAPAAPKWTRITISAISSNSSNSAGSGGGGSSSSSTTNTTSNRRNVLATTASTANARADKKIGKLQNDGRDEPAVFKKPSVSPQRRSKENQQLQQKQQEQRAKEEALSKKEKNATTANAGQASSSNQKYFPPETTIFSSEEGRVVKKITCYETWHVIQMPTDPPAWKSARQQRTCLELALVKLANVAARINLPSSKWSTKVTLYKVSPTIMQRQSMTLFTGDLKVYNISEEDRHKYQPSCVLFRRTTVDKTKIRLPYDRAIIFKNKCFYANIDGKQVNLLGSPESVTTVKDVEILLDVIDRLTLTSQLVETINSN